MSHSSLLNSHMWVVAPGYMRNISVVAGSSLDRAALVFPGPAEAGPFEGTGWTGKGRGGTGTSGQEEGLFLQSQLVLTHQSQRLGPGLGGIKPEPVTREWPGRAARGGLATQVPGRNV